MITGVLFQKIAPGPRARKMSAHHSLVRKRVEHLKTCTVNTMNHIMSAGVALVPPPETISSYWEDSEPASTS